MAFLDFLKPIFGSNTEAPQQTIVPVGQQLGGALATATGLMPQLTAYNTGLADQYGNYQDQLLGPAASGIQQAVPQNILSDLNLKYEADPALVNFVQSKFLENNANSGVGTSGAGLMFGRRSLLGLGRDFYNENLNRAIDYAQNLPSSRSTPYMGFSPESIANAESANQAAIDNQENIRRNIFLKNENELRTLGFKIAGTAAGVVGAALTKDPSMVQAGYNAGSLLAPSAGVAGYGQQQQQAGGSPFASILSGLNFGGIGGPRYGIGAGQQYIGPNGNIQTSTRASQVLG